MAIGTPWVGTVVQGNVAGSNATSVTVNVSGAANGEVCFIFLTLGDAETGTITAPSGWTSLGQTSEGTSGGSSSRLVIYWKVKASGDTNVSISGSGWTVTTKAQAVPISWPGVDTTTPTEQLTFGTAHTSGTSYVSGTATPTAATRWAVGIFSSRGSTASVAWTKDAALTSRASVINTSSVFVGLLVADSNAAVTQASHSYTSTGQSASHGLGAIMYLIPATAGATSANAGNATGTGTADNPTVTTVPSGGGGGAPPVRQTGTTLTGVSAANAVVTWPSGMQAGDVVLVTLYKENTAAVTTIPSGFTEKTGTNVPASTTAVSNHRVFWYRSASGGESGTITFAWTGSVWRAATAERYSGCIASGDPVDLIAGAFSNTNVATLNVALVGTAANTLLVWSGTDWAGGNAWTPPTGYTETADIDVVSTAWKSNVAGGNTGNVTGTANISGALTAILLSLKPTAAGGTNAPAGNATGTGTSGNPNPSVAPGPQAATATGTAYNPTVTTAGATSAPASTATGTGTAYNATTSTASATNAPAATATGTGTALDPTRTVRPTAGAGTATGTANTATGVVAPTPGTSTAQGTAQAATGRVAPGPSTATGTGTASNATVTTSGAANAQASTATGTGTASNATVTTSAGTSAPATLATGTGTAPGPTPAILPTAGPGTALGTAHTASPVVAPTPGTSTAQGTAQAASPRVAPGLSAATGTGTAYGPTVQTGSFTNAPAGQATGTGTAYPTTSTVRTGVQAASASGTADNATGAVGTSAFAGVATGTGTVSGPSVVRGVFVTAGLATATGSMPTATAKVSVSAGTASALATAYGVQITGAVTNAQSVSAVTAYATAAASVGGQAIASAVTGQATASAVTGPANGPTVANGNPSQSTVSD